MKVLVTYASRHGSTRGIAERIAETIQRQGLEVSLRPIGQDGSVEQYDAYVIGSAAYMTSWLKEATAFVRAHERLLAGKPVWLFSSGPVGDGKSTRHPETVPHPDGVDQLADEIGARGRAMFGGRVDSAQGGFAMAIMAKAGLEGDWRDLPRVRSWALEIAGVLRADA